MTPPPTNAAATAAPVLACAQGRLPPNVALAHLIGVSSNRGAVGRALGAARRDLAEGSPELARLDAMLALWRQTPAAWRLIRTALAHADHEAPIDAFRWAEVFDRLATLSPEAGVAIYSLGRRDLLDAATESIVTRLREWGLLGPSASVLDLGCGSGRLAPAVAHEVGSVVGADISAGMLSAARRRCSHLSNVEFVQTSGCDLAPFPDGAFSVIAAVDVFPYLVSTPDGAAVEMFAEARRVLTPRGTLLILNYAYGPPHEDQRSEVGERATRLGFEVVRCARGDFALWDGATFHLRRLE